MLKNLLLSIGWSLAGIGPAMAHPRVDKDLRQYGDGDESSTSIATVTVDWLPPHGPESSEYPFPGDKTSSKASDYDETDARLGENISWKRGPMLTEGNRVVTVTMTVYSPELTSNEVGGGYTDMYPVPPEPSSDMSSSTPPVVLTTTITHHGPCYPQPPEPSSSTEDISVVIVTVTTTEHRLVTVTAKVTEVVSTVVRTLSTRGPYAPPLTTW